MKLSTSLFTLFLGAALLPFLFGSALFLSAHPSVVNWQRALLQLEEQSNEAKLTALYLSGWLDLKSFAGSSLLLTEDELSHLQETRRVFDRIRHNLGGLFVAGVALVIFTSLVFKRRVLLVLANALKMDLLLVLGFLLALPTSFPFLFARVHLLLFPKGGFLFPEDSLLIQLFPEVFFRNAAILILLLTLIFLFSALGVVKLLERR